MPEARRRYLAYAGNGIPGLWYVANENGATVGVGSEAEASIIAFALNAVAEGYTLTESRRHFACGCPHRIRDYDGPTEGVAP